MSTPIRSVQFDRDLVAKYDITGPRYTSYPTAPQYNTGFGEREYRAWIQKSNQDAQPRALSLYLHLPYCSSPCFYCGCTRMISRQRGPLDTYLNRLCREIERVGALFDKRRIVRQIHLGGGTPNLLDNAQMERLIRSLRDAFTFDTSAQREFAIEVDPRHASPASVAAMAALGFNRISVGIQDFDPVVQRAVNRMQSLELTRSVIDAAREHGFRSVNADLIYGLPKQSLAGFDATLRAVLELKPDRIAAYSYAHLPRLFKPQRRIVEADLPTPAEKLALFEHTVGVLLEGGYHYIGMDHFALPGDDLVRAQRDGTLQRNFQGYSTHADCDIVGLGMSAIGRIGDCYAQNAREHAAYSAAVDAGRLPIVRGIVVTAEDLLRREIIGEIMCHGRLDFAAFGDRHALRFRDRFAEEIERLATLERDGLVELAGDTLSVTGKGRLLLRPIAMTFDAYLPRDHATTLYSRTI
ncbi:MAG: oxygen-independent coproporphyrinogen III oxidase [Rhodanobacter sp.]|jgi:oxygen-independent coproporphyrinogen-3 oxidase|nr:oxygen-independent coproporphyrinogen III oxidase [Rhodanobacter sp.]